MSSFENAFMEIVQLHERSWGMDQYPGRPTLSDLLSSPIVIMWTGGNTRPAASIGGKRITEPQSAQPRFMLSIHHKIEELNEVLLGMIVAGKVTPNSQRKISRIFVNKKPVKITGVRLMIVDD